MKIENPGKMSLFVLMATLALTSSVCSQPNVLGEFTTSIADLKETTTCYTRAYAINGAGVGYGQEQKFTTMKEPYQVKPIVYLDSTTFRDTTIIQQHWIM